MRAPTSAFRHLVQAARGAMGDQNRSGFCKMGSGVEFKARQSPFAEIAKGRLRDAHCRVAFYNKSVCSTA